MVDRGYSWIDQFGQVVEVVGRFSQLLDMNCDAMYCSFSSILRLFESVAELRREVLFIFQTFTIFKLLQTIAARLSAVTRLPSLSRLLPAGVGGSSTASLPSSASSSTLDVDAFASFQDGRGVGGPASRDRAQTRKAWPFILFLVSALCGPIVINKLWSILKSLSTSGASSSAPPRLDGLWDDPSAQTTLARALYDYTAQAPQDLGFSKGDVITVVERLPGGWWVGRLNGRTGHFPVPYVEIVDDPATSLPSASPSLAQTQAQTPTREPLEMEPLKLHLNSPSLPE
jgi:hypothetical protein